MSNPIELTDLCAPLVSIALALEPKDKHKG